MSYHVPPGLYAIGAPTPGDPVAVTANYKMSFDSLRSALDGRSAWILVLETFGVNVWCAAGKGTFGTQELIRRVAETELSRVVRHRTLLLPILGAPGVAAHEVARGTGFTVRYAAIRAGDFPEYLDNGMVTTEAMRQITFSFRERLVLVPVELVTALRPVFAIAMLLFIAGWGLKDASAGISATAAFLGAVVAGTVAGPLLLPWIPVPSFAGKGALVGLVWGLIWCLGPDLVSPGRRRRHACRCDCRLPRPGHRQFLLHAQFYRVYPVHLPLRRKKGAAGGASGDGGIPCLRGDPFCLGYDPVGKGRQVDCRNG